MPLSYRIAREVKVYHSQASAFWGHKTPEGVQFLSVYERLYHMVIWPCNIDFSQHVTCNMIKHDLAWLNHENKSFDHEKHFVNGKHCQCSFGDWPRVRWPDAETHDIGGF